MAAELLKYGPSKLVDTLLNLFLNIWKCGSVPQMWKDVNLVTIYKNKGDRAQRGNSKGIALLPVPSKALAKMLR